MSEALAAMRLDFELQVAKVMQQAEQINRALGGIGTAGQAAASEFDRHTAKMAASVQQQTAASTQAIKTWTEFLKGRMGPAMREFGGDHSKAINKLAAEWAEYKRSGQLAAAAVVQSNNTIVASTQQLSANEARFMESLKRQSVQLSEGRAAWLAMRAAQLGLTQEAAPYIARMRQAEAANDGVHRTAREMSFALRQVPMQFTDIWTSLASGQRPLQVFMQQGGQLKDLFGGIGPAARALGSYVLGLINPVTVAIAALAGLAIAWKQGDDEQREFQKHAVLTGNAVAVSASQYTQMRDAVASIGATRGKAAEVLAEIAKNGQISASSMQLVAQTAVMLEKAADVSIADTVKNFAKLADEPVKASEELNKQYRYLTAAVYAQIKALDEQGKSQEAVAVAERAYADEMKRRSATVIENIGWIEKAWRGVISAAKGAWDAMLSIGRSGSLAEQLADANRDLARAQGAANPFIRERDTEAARQRIANLHEQVRMEQRLAERMAERQRIEQAGIEFMKEGDQYRSRAQQRDIAIQKELVRGQELVNAGLITQAQLDARIAAIREKFAEKGGAAKTFHADTAALKSYSEAMSDFAKIAAGAQAKAEELSKTQAKLREIMASPVWAQYSRQQQEQIIYAAALSQAEEDRAIVLERIRKEQEQMVGAAQKDADAIRARADEQERANAAFGLGKVALEEMTLAQYRQSLADLEATDRVIPGYIEALRRKIAEQERLVEAMKRGAELTAGKAAADEMVRQAARAQQEWERTNEQISQSFVDALMRGGKSVAQYLKDLFRTLILRPILQPIGNMVAGAVNGMFGGAMQGMGMSLGGNMLGGGIGSLFAGTGGIATGAGLSGALFGTGGGASAYAMSAGALEAGVMTSGVGGTAGLMGGIQGALAAIPGWGWALMAAAAVAALLKEGGGPKADGRFGWTVSDIGAGGTTSQLNSAAMSTAQGLQATFDALAKLGGLGGSGVRFGAGISTDPEGDSPSFLDITASRDGSAVWHVLNRNIGRTQEELTAAMTQMGSQALLGALQSVMWEMPPVVRRELEGIDTTALTTEAAQGIAATIQKALTEKAALEDREFVLTHTDAEILAAARAKERDALDESNRALYDRIIALEDEKAAAEEAKAAAEKAAEIAKQRSSMEAEIARLQGDVGPMRALELAALDESLQPLQERIWALQDEAEAAAKAKAIADEKSSMEVRILELQGDAAGATALRRQIELSTMEESLIPLQERIYALEDEAEAAAKAKVIADQKKSLDVQLLTLQGDTAALRQLELDALDPSNHALQEHIWKLQDEKTAAEEAAKAIERANSRFSQLESVASSFMTPSEFQGFQAQTIADKINALTGGNLSAETVAGTSKEQFADFFKTIWQAGNMPLADLLLEIAPRFLSMRQGIDGPGLEIAKQAFQMDKQIAQLRGDTNTVREMELSQLPVELHEKQKLIWALQDEAEAEAKRTAALAEQARAAEELRRTWAQLADSMMDEAARLRGLVNGNTPQQSLAYLQTQFAMATAAARAGDTKAGGQLVGLSQAIDRAAMDAARTRPELNSIRSQLADSLQGTAAAVSPQQEMLTELREMRRENAARDGRQKTHEKKLEELNTKMKDVLDRAFNPRGRLYVTTEADEAS